MKTRALCPICETYAVQKFGSSPYWMCRLCDLWFQDPLPPKIFEGDHEKTPEGTSAGHLMGDAEKQINADLAQWLLTKIPGLLPSRTTLDIGSKYPYLASCLHKLGCDAYAIDSLDDLIPNSKELQVKGFACDFEEERAVETIQDMVDGVPSLITLVHVFEHLYRPLEALKKLRCLIHSQGRVFLRLPDHSVAGFEANLVPSHYTIHPYFYSLESILELLRQAKDLFVVEYESAMVGAGQRDIILRPISRAPTMFAGMIVKNEERDLPRALKSLAGVVDGLVLVDTGSTDKTVAVAKEAISLPSFAFLPSCFRSQHGQDRYLLDTFGGFNLKSSHLDALHDGSVYLDIGAHDGVEYSNTYFFDKSLRWKGICVEPIPEAAAACRKNRPTTFVIEAAASNHEGTEKFFHPIHRTIRTELMSGLVDKYDPRHFKRVLSEMEEHGGEAETLKVQTFPLQALMAVYPAGIKYLSLDTEGSELEILKAASDELLGRIEIISVEANHPDVFEQQRTFLESKGFVFKKRVGDDSFFCSLEHHIWTQDARVDSGILGDFEFYTGASKKDKATGEWQLWDFSKARNRYVARVEELRKKAGPLGQTIDYLFWFDADDELLTPEALRRTIYLQAYSVFGIPIQNGTDRFIHHRIWRTGLGIVYEGKCHEYPTIGGHPAVDRPGITIRHDTTPGFGENANARNLRILSKEMEEKPSPRSAFYLGNTHYDAGRFAEAISAYDRRLKFGEQYRDEWLMTKLRRARCLKALGKMAEAKSSLFEALSSDSGWSEFWMELAFIAYDEKKWSEAIGLCILSIRPLPPNGLWQEVNKYTDQPLRLMSFCYENMGQMGQARCYAEQAKAQIRGPDAEWDERIRKLGDAQQFSTPGVMTGAGGVTSIFSASRDKKTFAIHRPGAIGDVLMTLNLVPLLKKQYEEIYYFCHESIAKGVEKIAREAGVKLFGIGGKSMIKDISQVRRDSFTKWVDAIGYPLQEGYPDKPMKRHLLEYFADEFGVKLERRQNRKLPIASRWPSDEKILEQMQLPALTLKKPPMPSAMAKRFQTGNYATIQTKTGWSPYKNWPANRWADVMQKLSEQGVGEHKLAEIPFVQIGLPTDPRIPGVAGYLGDLEGSIALVANARMHVGLDSFANHLTHYRWVDNEHPEGRQVPGVILWGSTQVSASGYESNVNISGNPAFYTCQPCFKEDPAVSQMPRGECVRLIDMPNEGKVHDCMNSLSVDLVVEEIIEVWNRRES